MIGRVGFRKPVQGQTEKGVFATNGEGATYEYLVLPEAFKTEICAGIDYKHAARVLADAGCLEKGEGRNFAQNRRLPGMGATRCYVINPKIWETD